jgi:tetratricopeptide (TPR) repeat protein
MRLSCGQFVIFFVATLFVLGAEEFEFNPHGRFYPEAVVYLRKGTQMMDSGDVQGARNCFDAAIRIDKGIWPAYIDRAQVFARMRQWPLALQDCETAARLRPDFYRTFIVRAMIYADVGKCGEALVDLNKVLSFHGGAEVDSLALSRRALLHATCHDAKIYDPKLALTDAKQACDTDHWIKPDYISILAVVSASTGDFDSAVRYQRQAINTGKYSPAELQEAQRHLARFEHHQR